MATPALNIDVAILGGGVTGLWALNLLRDRGYSAALFEERALGSGQTIGSQGIIHGGIKYALGGVLTSASESIAAMPDAWRACLEGDGQIDLRDCALLSDASYLWSSGDAGSGLTGFLASKMLRGRVTLLEPDDYPTALQHRDFRGRVYRLPEPVLDVSSLLATLSGPHVDAIFSINWQQAKLRRLGGRVSLALPGVELQPQCLLLTAGSGNEALIRALGASAPAMQRRPLQQLLVKHEYPEPLFGHCIGRKAVPRVTISSHRANDGRPVWYLGGELATGGADEAPDRLIQRAQEELATLLPWIDLGQSDWSAVRLDRAEPQQAGTRRPDDAFLEFVEGLDNVLVGWPGKLALAPRLGDLLLGSLAERAIQPRYGLDTGCLAELERPEKATPLWDTPGP